VRCRSHAGPSEVAHRPDNDVTGCCEHFGGERSQRGEHICWLGSFGHVAVFAPCQAGMLCRRPDRKRGGVWRCSAARAAADDAFHLDCPSLARAGSLPLLGRRRRRSRTYSGRRTDDGPKELAPAPERQKGAVTTATDDHETRAGDPSGATSSADWMAAELVEAAARSSSAADSLQDLGGTPRAATDCERALGGRGIARGRGVAVAREGAGQHISLGERGGRLLADWPVTGAGFAVSSPSRSRRAA